MLVMAWLELKLLLLELKLLLLELELLQLAAGEDRQVGAEAEGGVAVEEDRGAGGRSSAIGVSQSTTTLECLMQSSSRGRPP